MIEFRGEMSKKGIRLLKRIQTFPIFFVCPLVVTLFELPIFEFVLSGRFFSIERIPTFAFSYGIVALILLVICLLMKNENHIPLCIEVIPGRLVKSQCKKKTHVFSIQEVRKVIDYGDFYSIRIDKQFEHGHFLCQKDLLTKGSIEEFEKTFQNKIIRKVKMKNHEN